MTPRVSILIPNYNNGRQSSVNGQIDLLGNLLQSLWNTLVDDPTPFEIIAYDDGSTDDSLETLREWSRRTWPETSGGRATEGGRFLTLIEAEHCGILAKNANILSRRARGDIFARLDGDTVCLTPRWVSKLCEIFDNGPPRLGVVGPKQLRPDGRIHAFGDWILHPNGYTHLAAGMDRYAVQTPMEVDHVMGCFYCHRRAVYEEIGGYDEAILRGQTIDFGLRARLHGWSCFAVPHIEFIHAHGHRTVRKTTADSQEGVRNALDVFEQKWGFNRIAPDMDEVRRRYAGTPLLWNARFFATPVDGWPCDALSSVTEPIQIERTDWVRYTKDAAFKNNVDLRIALTLDVVRQTGRPGKIGVVGSGCGLLPHLLATQGVNVIATERLQPWVNFAQRCVVNQKYPDGTARPQFLHQSHPRRLPIETGAVDLLLIYDQLERHPNPVALLREAHRVLKPDGLLVLLVKRKNPADDLAPDIVHPYSTQQLFMQMNVVGGWAVLTDPVKEDASQPFIVFVARRIAAPQRRSAETDPTSLPVGLSWNVRRVDDAADRATDAPASGAAEEVTAGVA